MLEVRDCVGAGEAKSDITPFHVQTLNTRAFLVVRPMQLETICCILTAVMLLKKDNWMFPRYCHIKTDGKTVCIRHIKEPLSKHHLAVVGAHVHGPWTGQV